VKKILFTLSIITLFFIFYTNKAFANLINIQNVNFSNSYVISYFENRVSRILGTNFNIMLNSDEKISYESLEKEEINQYKNHIIHTEINWSLADEIFPRESDATIIDVLTGESFRIRRTFGTNHADVEPLTEEDTRIIYNLWGGHSWTQRAVIVITDTNHVMPASMNGFPHAGLDGHPVLDVVDNRSGGYGRGQNFDAIKGNGTDGHFCIHFADSRTHGSRNVHSGHQNMIRNAQQYIIDNF